MKVLEHSCNGTFLGSFLSGQALDVYSRLPAPEARDYDKLKEALMVQYQLTKDDYRKKLYKLTKSVCFLCQKPGHARNYPTGKPL